MDNVYLSLPRWYEQSISRQNNLPQCNDSLTSKNVLIKLLVWCSHQNSITEHQCFATEANHLLTLLFPVTRFKNLLALRLLWNQFDFIKIESFYIENTSKLVTVIAGSTIMSKAGNLQSNQMLFYFFLEFLGSRRQSLPLCWAGTVPIKSTISFWRAWLGLLQSSKTHQKVFSECIQGISLKCLCIKATK